MEAIAEKLSGKKLELFFRQWLYTAGQPEISVKWKYLVKEKKLSLAVDQLQKNGPFSFPLELSIQTATGKPVLQKITVSKTTEMFIISVKEKPVKIELDPNTSLLFAGSATELK